VLDTADTPEGARHLVRGASSLAASTVVTSALGMAFWLVAARLCSNVEVGRDAALISALVELSTICQLNLGNGAIRFLPQLGRSSRRVVAASYGVTSLLALLAGALFVFLAPSLSSRYGFVATPTLRLAFTLALPLWGVFALQDAVLVATRSASWVPVENGLFGALKLAALLAAAWAGIKDGVFVAWVVPMALLLVPVNALVFRRAIPRHVAARPAPPSSRPGGLGAAARFLGQDYAASILTQATLTSLPLLVLGLLGARASSFFVMPFTIAMAFDTFAASACATLVVEAGRDPGHLGALARIVVTRLFVFILPAALLAIAAAPLLLRPFGPGYATHGSTVLRLLLATCVIRTAVMLFAAISRSHRRGARLVVTELALVTLSVGGAALLARTAGIDGVALAWLGANAVVAVAILPGLIRFLRPQGAAAGARVASRIRT
jgi:O-antigen/teichoic acid export membrane protein